MAAKKTFALSIVLGAIDKATGPIRRVTARLDRATAPVSKLSRRIGDMTSRAGKGLSEVGGKVRSLAGQFAAVAAAAGLSAAGINHLLTEGDQMAKLADRVGVSVDALAQLRFAAGQAGAETSRMDDALKELNIRLGEARSGGGSLAGFLKEVSPALLRQMKAAKGTEEALGLMADALRKVKDPAKRAALANAAFGEAGVGLLNLLTEGSDGINALRKEYAQLAGSQEKSARSSERVKSAMGRVSAAMDGIKAGIVSGLAPAFLELSKRASAFFVANREKISAWVQEFGRKLPDRIGVVIGMMRKVGAAMAPLLDYAKEIVMIFAGVKVGGMVSAFSAAGGAMGSFAGKLGGAASALTAFYGALKIAVKLLEAKQEKDIQQAVNDKSLRRHLIGGLAGGRAGYAAARAQGIVGKDGQINRALLRQRLTTDSQRRVMDSAWLTGSGGANAVRKQLDLEVKRAVANLQQGRAAQRAYEQQKARIEVEFSNAPTGTRVKADPRSTADVDLTTGYQVGM